jgi:hypothetical protein
MRRSYRRQNGRVSDGDILAMGEAVVRRHEKFILGQDCRLLMVEVVRPRLVLLLVGVGAAAAPSK